MDQILAAFSSNDDEIQKQAADSMNEMIFDPSFYSLLFENLTSNFNDPKTTQILLILHESIRRAYKYLDIDIKNYISSNIFNFALELNDLTNASTIIESILFIFSDESTNPDTIIEQCFSTILSIDPHSLLKDHIALSIISNWLLVYGVKKAFFTQEIHELLKQLFPKFIYLTNQQNSITEESLAVTRFSFIPLIIKIIDHMIFRDSFLIFDNDLLIQIQQLIEILNSEECPPTEKSSIYAFLTIQLNSFINPNCDENKKEFHQNFLEICVPILFDHLINHFPKNTLHITYCLQLLNTFFKYQIGLDYLLNLEYFYTVLVKSCILSDEDIENFETVPEQFFSFCYDISPLSVNSYTKNDKDDILTPRYTFSKLFSSICSKYSSNEIYQQFIQNLIQILATDSDNDKEIEVKLFVFSLYTKHFQEDQDVFNLILQTLEATDSQIITATCLAGLINLDIEKEKRLEIATHFILGSENQNPCISLMSLYLFDRCFIIDDSLTSDLNELISSILNIAGSICDPLPGILLNTLYRHYPQLFTEYSLDIIQTLISMWPLYQESHNGDNIILGITNIISTLPSESEIFQSLVSPLLEFVIEQFKDNPNNECERQMLELIKELVLKIQQPTEDIISLIPFFIELIQTGNFFYLIDQFVKITSIIVSMTNVFSYDGFFDQTVELVTILLNSEELPASSLLLVSAIIQNAGPESISLVELSFPFLESKSDEVFLSAFTIICSSIIVNYEGSISIINQSVFSLLFEYIDRISNCDPIVLPLIINAISLLTLHNIDERALESCFFLAQKLYHIIEIAKQSAKEEEINLDDIDLNDDSFFDDDESDIITKNTVYLLHILPSDKLTLKESLVPLSSNQNLIESLSEENKNFYQNIIS